jgi:hypothetical protein
MTETKDFRVKSRELAPGFLIIFLSFILSIVVPLLSPVLGVLLLVTGVYAYRHATDAAMRTIAIANITSGILILIIMILIWLFFISSNITATSSIENYPGR